jgi:hypothetical protein
VRLICKSHYLAETPRLPQRLLTCVGSAAEDEEEVGTAVEVTDHLRVEIFDKQSAALSAAADGSANVEMRGGRRPTWKNE